MDPQDLAARVSPLFQRRMAARGIYPRPVSEKEFIDFSVLVARWLGAISTSSPGNPLLEIISNLDAQMDIYESVNLLDEAVSHIPLEALHQTAEQTQETNALPCYEDALAEALVKWFKPSFFEWADPIKCPTCSRTTEMRSMVQPTREELDGGGKRVEFHACVDGNCNGSVRFARFNDPARLMRTRMGRCGEFANLFCLFLRAIGLRTRYVWNAEDHVWNEYWSPGLNRWVHLDSCENIRDQPLLYDRGWGKKQSYCLAFSVEGAQDVTKGYVVSWDETMSRRGRIGEELLANALSAVTKRRRFGLSPEEIGRLEREDASQLEWLGAGHLRVGGAANEQTRQSGTREWKEARGETGDN